MEIFLNRIVVGAFFKLLLWVKLGKLGTECGLFEREREKVVPCAINRYLRIASSRSSPPPSPLASGLGLRRILQSDSANKNSARASELGLSRL